MSFYGSRYRDVLSLIDEKPFLRERLCSCSLAIKAQVVYALKVEMACKEEDIVLRRLSLEYMDCPQKHCRQEVQKLMSEYLVS